ncbi:autotransporter domain-containing protein [Phaeobacter gallaeciensis]|uniref:autotransporter domain-containing protein n=1 Tax=Phaeobacter gallaeciensis TaxID=60890 RepID=UPI000BBCABF5|nr:autotransporter outer membrane beta-barrel domain-containing protein [Phaeobacter gallaeciensis]ATF18787.1 outer membrane autotransporter barrel domain protein [Phaeobacter gallaeciensis]ATF22896.1 outer membrane autotransporter barrel domain protein [Phaeobacter gallaeciensis]
MEKALITFATVFALVSSAGTSSAGPLCSQRQCGSHTGGDLNLTTNRDDQQYSTDFSLGELAGGEVFGTLEFGVSNLSSIVNTRLISADISSDAYDVTLGARWVADSALYIDGQLRYGHFDSSISLNGQNVADVSGSGYEVSVEVGKPLSLQNGLTLIPQMEFTYSDIHMDDAADRVGSGRIGSLLDGDTLMTRFGLRAERAFQSNTMLYGQIDVYHAFDSDTSLVAGQNTAALSIGGNVSLTDHSQLYAEVTSETELGSSSGDDTFSWNIGFEVQF